MELYTSIGIIGAMADTVRIGTITLNMYLRMFILSIRLQKMSRMKLALTIIPRETYIGVIIGKPIRRKT